MSDRLLSLIRTLVPVLVGSALAWLAARTGIVLPEHVSAELAIVATVAAITLYYALVRWLETRWPWFGLLLGAAKEPVYTAPAELQRVLQANSRLSTQLAKASPAVEAYHKQQKLEQHAEDLRKPTGATDSPQGS